MEDAIIAGTGNSRTLKTVENALELYPTYEDMIRGLVEGTFPVDLLLNPSGFLQMGDPLNKTNILKDQTAALYGKTPAATPDEIFAEIKSLIAGTQTSIQELAAAKGNCFIETGAYSGTAESGAGNKIITTTHIPQAIIVGVANNAPLGFSGDYGYFQIGNRAFTLVVTSHLGVTLSPYRIQWGNHEAYISNVMNLSGFSYYYTLFST